MVKCCREVVVKERSVVEKCCGEVLWWKCCGEVL